jgi:hypothetical protein
MDQAEQSRWFLLFYDPIGGDTRDDPVILLSGRDPSDEKE